MTDTGAELQEYLGGLEYPFSRQDLIRWCQENGASTEVLQKVRALPMEEFESPAELNEALRTMA